MVVLFSGSLVEFYNNGESLIFNIVIRRMFYLPSYICSQYYDFFSQNEKLWLRQDAFFVQNIFQRISERPYPYGATKVISEKVYEGCIPSPNTGMIAEPYAQFGILGIFIFPFIIYFIFKYLYHYSSVLGIGAMFVVMFKFYGNLHSMFILTPGSVVAMLVFITVCFLIEQNIKGNQFNLSNKV